MPLTMGGIIPQAKRLFWSIKAIFFAMVGMKYVTKFPLDCYLSDNSKVKSAAYGRALNPKELAAAARPHRHIADLGQDAGPLHTVEFRDEWDQLSDEVIAHQFHDLVFATALAAVE